MNKEMKVSEADKIIAEFMRLVVEKKTLGKTSYMILNDIPAETIEIYKGGKLNPPRYSQSLDALVPVWEKLDDYVRLETLITAEGDDYWGVNVGTYTKKHLGLEQTIQQAAAIATAKCILELDK